MFQKIVFATDFSDSAQRAYEKLKQIRTECNAQSVIIVSVIDEREIDSLANLEGFYSIQIEKLREEVTQELIKQTEAKIEKCKKGLRELGFDVEVRIPVGIPYDEIVKIAEKEGAGLIVMGSHGKGILQELLIGSTSEKVLRRAKCPVLIVK